MERVEKIGLVWKKVIRLPSSIIIHSSAMYVISHT